MAVDYHEIFLAVDGANCTIVAVAGLYCSVAPDYGPDGRRECSLGDYR
jgi:hypothetical protein